MRSLESGPAAGADPVAVPVGVPVADPVPGVVGVNWGAVDMV